MKKRIIAYFCCLYLSLFCFCISAEAVTENELNQELYAKSALLMDADSGRVLYEKSGYQPMKNASTTKILTCIVALEQGTADRLCKVSEYATSQPKVRLGVKKDMKFKLKDLLYSLMLESHNDSAVVIAETVGGSVERFAKLMNRKAKEIGAKDTTFVTPNGLDAENHHTTAYDLALLTRYALKNKQFVQIINCPSYTFSDADDTSQYSVYNKNAFLNSYEGAYGVKTGFTGEAGYCFVGASKDSGHDLISVVLASGWPPNKAYKWADTKRLMDYGRKEFSKKTIRENMMLPVFVSRGCKENVAVACQDYHTLVRENDRIATKINLPQKIKAPVYSHQRLGWMEVYINDKMVKKIPIYTKEKVDKITFPFTLKEVLSRFVFQFGS